MKRKTRAAVLVLTACSAAKAPTAHNPTVSPLAAEVASPSSKDTWRRVDQSVNHHVGTLLPRPPLAPQPPMLPLRTALWPLPRQPQEVPWLAANAPQQPCQRSLNNYWRAWCLYRSGEHQKAIHQMARSLGAFDPSYATAARIDFATMAGYHPDTRWLIERARTLTSSDPEVLDAVIASLVMLGKLDDVTALEFAQSNINAVPGQRKRLCERRARQLQLAGPLNARSLLTQRSADRSCATMHHLECNAAMHASPLDKLDNAEFWSLCGWSSAEQPELAAHYRVSGDYITWDSADRSANTWYRTAIDAARLLALDPAAEPMFDAALRNYIEVAGCTSRAQTETATLTQPYLQYLDLHYRNVPAYLHRLTSITSDNCAAIQAELRAAPVASPP